MTDDDAVLMGRVAGGDTHAFRMLVEKYQGEIFNFFLRSTGNREDAEDLAQQSFLNVYRSADRYRPTASFRTYLYRVATNLAISFSRKQKVRPAVSLDQAIEDGYQPASADSGDDPAVYTQRRELQRAYAAAISSLPDDWRIAIELRVGRNFSYREIAGIMGKSVSAVESILFRARERLARELAPFRDTERHV